MPQCVPTRSNECAPVSGACASIYLQPKFSKLTQYDRNYLLVLVEVSKSCGAMGPLRKLLRI